MNNTLSILREKLELYNKSYINNEYLEKILNKFGSNYTISQLCNKGLLEPIKRGKWYINKKSKDYIDPYIIGSLYMGDSTYVFGGISVYNKYSLSTQVAEWYTIYNTKISGKKIIGNNKFLFIKQRESFFYGLNKKNNQDYSFFIFSPERAFIQLIKEKKVFNKLPYGINANKLVKIAKNNVSNNIYQKIEKICSTKI